LQVGIGDGSEAFPDDFKRRVEIGQGFPDITGVNLEAASPFAVVATKIDVAGDRARLRELQKYCTGHRYTCLPISAATREGLTELVTYVGQQVAQLRATP
jgi:50S ribosomal subunit-associated GTPase HflX